MIRRIIKPRPSASVDNNKLWLNNSSYHAQPHSIIVKYLMIFCLLLDYGQQSFHTELRQHYNAITELLRHFWSCFPVTSTFLEEKVRLKYSSRVSFALVLLK